MLTFFYRLFEKLERKALCQKLTKKGKNRPNVLGKCYIQVKDLILGKNVTLYPGAYLWGNDIRIGDNVDIGINTIIYGRECVKIGNNTSIAALCYIIDSNHGTTKEELIREQGMETKPIEIGDDVWIGAQCMILKGSKIGNGAVIGANSLVNSEIPPYAIAYGTPARVHGFRKSKTNE